MSAPYITDLGDRGTHSCSLSREGVDYESFKQCSELRQQDQRYSRLETVLSPAFSLGMLQSHGKTSRFPKQNFFFSCRINDTRSVLWFTTLELFLSCQSEHPWQDPSRSLSANQGFPNGRIAFGISCISVECRSGWSVREVEIMRRAKFWTYPCGQSSSGHRIAPEVDNCGIER